MRLVNLLFSAQIAIWSIVRTFYFFFVLFLDYFFG